MIFNKLKSRLGKKKDPVKDEAIKDIDFYLGAVCLPGVHDDEYMNRLFNSVKDGDGKGLFEPINFFKLFAETCSYIAQNIRSPIKVIEHLEKTYSNMDDKQVEFFTRQLGFGWLRPISNSNTTYRSQVELILNSIMSTQVDRFNDLNKDEIKAIETWRNLDTLENTIENNTDYNENTIDANRQKEFHELFYNKIDADLTLSVMRELEFINEQNIWIATDKSKSAIMAVIHVLKKRNKIEPLHDSQIAPIFATKMGTTISDRSTRNKSSRYDRYYDQLLLKIPETGNS